MGRRQIPIQFTARRRIIRMPSIVPFLTVLTILMIVPARSGVADSSKSLVGDGDRIFLLNLRHQPSGLCNVKLPTDPIVHTLDACGRPSGSSMEYYLQSLTPQRPTIIYVHGNRYTSADAIEYGMYVYRRTRPKLVRDVNWVIWSWPADRDGFLGHDVREKASRTDGQAFLMADLLKHNFDAGSPTTLIGFSFGGRIITGALHALAGGSLRGIVMPGEPLTGGQFAVGLVAPAIERNWLSDRGYHRLATKNMEQLTLLYNRRDIVLKRYWLIDKVRGQIALGYSGPTTFASRSDGTELPVHSHDCTAIVGLQHDETDYYESRCRGATEMAQLIRSTVAAKQSGQTLVVESPGDQIETVPTPASSSNVLFSRPMLIQTKP